MHLGRSIPFRDLVMDYTVPQDITGLPACVVRAGFDTLGLPVGVQATAPARREDLALRVGSVLEHHREEDERWPAEDGMNHRED
jgi:Asp-tRNA(Asn)/Glu-tRNA(Gln) amidotransferase A subunit family amidase